jgi:methylamine dehydrogenase accessory protein MauD
MTVLLVSNVLLWVTQIGLLLTVLALARQVGVIHERLAPVGALTMDHGPKVGEPAPEFALPGIGGAEIRIGAATGRSQLLFFLSPTCPVCKQLLPVLRSLSRHEKASLDVVLASDGKLEEHRRFYEREKLAPFPYVLSTELGMTFRISKLPYAVVIGPSGLVSAKGLINNREQLESLLIAQEMGVASLQDYRARTASRAAADVERREGDVVTG